MVLTRITLVNEQVFSGLLHTVVSMAVKSSETMSPAKLVASNNHPTNAYLPTEKGAVAQNEKNSSDNVICERNFFGIPLSSWSTLIVCCGTDFLFETCDSVHAPFFPEVVRLDF